MKIELGHQEAREKLTGRLFWRLLSESGFVDAGNVREYTDATTRSLVARSRSKDGARHVNDEQADLNHEAWTFLLDERVPEQERLLKLAITLTDGAQAESEGVVAVIENVALGAWHEIGAYGIANVSATASRSGALSATDFVVDSKNGMVQFKREGRLKAGESVTLTFDEPAGDYERCQTQKAPLFYCEVVIEEHNQFHGTWLRRSQCRAYINVTEFPSQTGEFGTYRVKVTPAGAVAVTKRPDGQTMPESTGAGAPGNSSSSSSTFESLTSSSSSPSSLSSSSSSSTEASFSSSSSTSTAADDTSVSSQSSSSSSTHASFSSSSSPSTEAGESSSSSTEASLSSEAVDLSSASSASTEALDTSSSSNSSSSSSTEASFTSSSSSSTEASETSSSSSYSSSSSSHASFSSSSSSSLSSSSTEASETSSSSSNSSSSTLSSSSYSESSAGI